MKKIIFSIFICLFVLTFNTQPTDALAITLKRIVFEGPKRAEVLTVINSSNETRTYRISWRHFLMNPDKSLVAVSEEGPLPPEVKPVTDMVRFAPRRFTLAPKTSQQVRIMLRMPGGIPDGEYRSHLWVRPEANAETFRKEAEKEARGGVTIQMLAGVTMPVIVRKGSVDADIYIENLSAYETNGFIKVGFNLNRSGDRSVYGNMNFVCNKNQGSQEYTIKTNRGNAVYSEINTRRFSREILKKAGQPACNSMTVEFFETEESVRAEKALFTESTVPVQRQG